MKIRGLLSGVAYDVEVADGRVAGSKRVSRLVALHTGRSVMAGPTGPLLTVDVQDSRSVVALLNDKGTVAEVGRGAGVATQHLARVW